MDLLQVSLNDLARLCHLASLGKLLGGLIHNLNSPLHSLGMQMDVMQHFILKKDALNGDVFEQLTTRLTQMNDEFDNLNTQIKIAGVRADFMETRPEKLDINHFLHQEMQFLKTNLYFKHNVATTLEFSPSLQAITPCPPYFNLAMGLFLESLAEELERMESKTLCLGTGTKEGRPTIVVDVGDSALSERFCGILEMNPEIPPSLQEIPAEMNLFISVVLLKTEGVTFQTESQDRGTSIKLMFSRDTRTNQ